MPAWPGWGVSDKAAQRLAGLNKVEMAKEAERLLVAD
jgi:hypothetical protein